MTARIGPRMRSIKCVVGRRPGQTAHYLAPYLYGAMRPMWGCVYAAFERARAAGLIRAERSASGITRYYPV